MCLQLAALLPLQIPGWRHRSSSQAALLCLWPCSCCLGDCTWAIPWGVRGKPGCQGTGSWISSTEVYVCNQKAAGSWIFKWYTVAAAFSQYRVRNLTADTTLLYLVKVSGLNQSFYSAPLLVSCVSTYSLGKVRLSLVILVSLAASPFL